MERLTERIYEDGTELVDIVNDLSKVSFGECLSKILHKLADYEDLEEQGRLLKLPCKVGDMLYYPEKLFDIVVPVRLNEIIISFIEVDTHSCQYNCCSFNGCGDAFEDYEFDTNDFGKTVFLTKSEAEAKLKELTGGSRE